MLLAGTPSTAEDRIFSGTVTAVRSGDTLVVQEGHRDRPIRLLGIDAPEPDQSFGTLSRARAIALALGRRVTVYPVREDPRGRTVAVVHLSDGRDLGLTLLVDGLARWDRRGTPNAPGLEQGELEARAAGRGMWRGTGTEAPPRL